MWNALLPATLIQSQSIQSFKAGISCLSRALSHVTIDPSARYSIHRGMHYVGRWRWRWQIKRNVCDIYSADSKVCVRTDGASGCRQVCSGRAGRQTQLHQRTTEYAASWKRRGEAHLWWFSICIAAKRCLLGSGAVILAHDSQNQQRGARLSRFMGLILCWVFTARRSA